MRQLIVKFIKVYLWPLIKRKIYKYLAAFMTKAFVVAAIVAAITTVIIWLSNRF